MIGIGSCTSAELQLVGPPSFGWGTTLQCGGCHYFQLTGYICSHDRLHRLVQVAAWVLREHKEII